MAENVIPGRLAFRTQGNFWHAYFAPLDSMEGALLMGTIGIGVIENSPHRKQQFMDLMKGIFDDFCQDQFKAKPIWHDPVTAPTHEESGNG